MDTNKNLKGGKFEPGSSASNMAGPSKQPEPKIFQNSIESEIIMEGFIGLPKNSDTSEGLGQKEQMQFQHDDDDSYEQE